MKLINGDCLEVLKELPDNSVETIITDPPYGLSKHKVEEVTECLSVWIKGEPYCPKASGGFMGKSWDTWVPGPEVWKECFRVLKPGGMCLVFAGTRSMDLMGMALRLSGFELRDSIGYLYEDIGQAPLLVWVHGQGFPKSANISKQIYKQAGVEREVIGDSPFAARKPNGSAGLNSVGLSSNPGCKITAPATEAAKTWEDYGTSLKPAFEPIFLAMKPIEKTFVNNALKHGVAGLNIEECRIEYTDTNKPIPQLAQGKTEINTENSMYGGNSYLNSKTKSTIGGSLAGRFPANIITDGSEQVLSFFPRTNSVKDKNPVKTSNSGFTGNGIRTGEVNYGDSGSAARFFYCAKASPKERNLGLQNNTSLKNTHPTVKPLSLLEYLCKLTKTPTSGTVLDPFMGSGTTGLACILTGRGFIGIEKDPQYFEIAKTRIENFTETLEQTKNIQQLSLFDI